MNDVISLLKEIVTRRKLIWDLAKADFKKRFVGSYFGMVWMFVQPLVTVLIYFFIFQLGFKSVPPVPGVPYVLWLVPGIVPWFFYSEALNCITACASAVMLSMLIAWTPLSSRVINGVQGRYFLPFLPVLLLALKNDWVVLTKERNRSILYLMCCLNGYELLRLYAIVSIRL